MLRPAMRNALSKLAIFSVNLMRVQFVSPRKIILLLLTFCTVFFRNRIWTINCTTRKQFGHVVCTTLSQSSASTPQLFCFERRRWCPVLQEKVWWLVFLLYRQDKTRQGLCQRRGLHSGNRDVASDRRTIGRMVGRINDHCDNTPPAQRTLFDA